MNSFKHKKRFVLAMAMGLAAVGGTQPAHAQATLGSAQQAGAFQVTLIGAPQTGRTRFEVRVSRDSVPVRDAQVTLNLAMPYHKHGQTIGRLEAMSEVFGQYAGTVKTPMTGIYDARVIVRSGNEKGTATFRFSTSDRPFVAHLGMWHPAGGFEVQLATDPAAATARKGENRVRVLVTREGFPVTEAQVNVSFSMPGMSRMGSAETSARLTPENGAFVGTANLIHSGPWRAFVTVKADSRTGRAIYDFPVK